MVALARFTNGADELTFSDDAWHPKYLGKATYVSTTAPATSGDTTDYGYQTYTITYSGQIVPVLKLTNTRFTRLMGMSQSGSTWTITLINTSSTLDARGFGTQFTTDVFVFGFPLSPVGPAGMLLFRADGSLAADLSTRPLSFRHRLALGSGAASIAVPAALTVPAVMGYPDDFRRQVSGSSPNTKVGLDSAGWTISTDGLTLSRAFVRMRYADPVDADPPPTTTYRPTTAYLVEANGLT